MGLWGVVQSALAARDEEHQQKKQENLQNLIESLYVYAHPDAARDQYNALQNLNTTLEEMYGKGYKEHKPFVERMLAPIGHGALNALGIPLHQRTPYIPTSMRPDDDMALGQYPAPQDMPQLQISPTARASGMPAMLAGGQAGQPVPGDIGGQVVGQAAGAFSPQQVGASPYYLTRPSEVPPLLAAGQTGQPVPGDVGAQIVNQAAAPGEPAAAPGPAVTQLAGGGAFAGVSPYSLGTGQAVPMMQPQDMSPMTRDQMRAAGGVLMNPRDPNSPIMMPYSQQAMIGGRLAIAEYQGLLGKGAQGAADYQGQLNVAVQQGLLRPEQANLLMQQFLADQATTTSAAGPGTEQTTYYHFPQRTDPDTGKTIPEHTEIMHRRSRSNEVTDQYGKVWTGPMLAAVNATETPRPPGMFRYNRTVRGDFPPLQAIFAQHPEWGKPNPSYSYQITYEGDPANPDAEPRIVGQVTPLGSSQRDPMSLRKNIMMAGNLYRQPNGQPLTADQAAYIGSRIQQREDEVRLAAAQQRMGVAQTVYGVQPGQGLLITPEEMAQIGVQQIPGAQIPAYMTNPTPENLPPEGGTSAPSSITPPPGLAQQMQGGGAPTVQPARIPPGIAPTPVPSALPTRLPPAAIAPAAGVPAAAPRAATPPQPPGTITIQPRPAGGYTIPPGPAAVTAQQRQPQFDRLGVPVQPRDVAEADAVQSYVDTISGKQPKFPGLAVAGARIIRQRAGISAGQLSQAASSWTGDATNLQNIQTRSQSAIGAADKLENAMDNFIRQSRNIPDYGSIVKNAFMRDFIGPFKNNPRLRAYLDSASQVQSAWTTVVSQAQDSKAQLQAGAMERGVNRINSNMTYQEALASMTQIKIEKEIMLHSYQQQKYASELSQFENPIGKATGVIRPNPVPPINFEEPGDNPPMDGDRRKIRGTNRFARFDALRKDARGRSNPGWVEEK